MPNLPPALRVQLVQRELAGRFGLVRRSVRHGHLARSYAAYGCLFLFKSCRLLGTGTAFCLLLPARAGLTATHHRRQEGGDGDVSERSACLHERPFPYLRWRRTLRGDLDGSWVHSRSRWRRVAAEGRPQSSTSQTARAPPSEETGVSPPVPGPGEVTSMRRQDHSSEASPTFLWIAWREGETDRVECLCRAHRAHLFEPHAASAPGLN